MNIFFRSNKTLSIEKSHGFEIIDNWVLITQTTINCTSLADIYMDCKFIYVNMFNCNCIYWLKNKTFRNCIFKRCDFKDMADHGNLFDECVFDEVDFRHSILGYDNSKYSNCIFRKVKFGHFIKAIFENCIFEDCSLDGVDFNASSFVHVSFSGSLYNVWFRGHFPTSSQEKIFGKSVGNEMKAVSFIDASLHDIDFSDDCKLSSVILPAKGLYAYYGEWRKQLNRIVECSDNDINTQKDGSLFFQIYSIRARTQNEYILNIDDLRKEYSHSFIDLLLQNATYHT